MNTPRTNELPLHVHLTNIALVFTNVSTAQHIPNSCFAMSKMYKNISLLDFETLGCVSHFWLNIRTSEDSELFFGEIICFVKPDANVSQACSSLQHT
jgi:hypothetical protein